MSDEFFYPNVWGLSILLALEEILGKNGVSAALNLAGLTHYVNNYPPDNIKKEFPFEAVSKLQQALWDMNGSRGAQVLAVRSGESTFTYSLEKFGKVQQAAAAAMKVGTKNMRIKAGLLFFAKFFNAVSDQQVRVDEDDTHWLWVIEHCPMCWQRTTDEPVCLLGVGVLNAATKWATSGDQFRIKAVQCIGMGAEEGIIKIEKPSG